MAPRGGQHVGGGATWGAARGVGVPHSAFVGSAFLAMILEISNSCHCQLDASKFYRISTEVNISPREFLVVLGAYKLLIN